MKSQKNVIVLQSFRNYDVPSWIYRCQDSVKNFALEQGYQYEFLGDEFFDFAPQWAREVCAQNIWSLSDICRLEWMKKCLADKVDVVIWADIDILIFDQRQIILELEKSFGFSYELYFDTEGAHHGLNNAFMFFSRGSDMLERYLDFSYERLKAEANKTERTGIGPDLLRTMEISNAHIIHGITILNIKMMEEVFRNPTKGIPDFITSKTKGAIGAVNLCLNERQCFAENARYSYDFIVDEVSRTLIK